MKNLPNEIIWVILQYLPIKDIYHSIQVNKRFYQVTKNDNFWKECFESVYDLKGELDKIELEHNIPLHSSESEIVHRCFREQTELKNKIDTELYKLPNWKIKLEKYIIITRKTSKKRKRRRYLENEKINSFVPICIKSCIFFCTVGLGLGLVGISVGIYFVVQLIS